MDQNQWFQKKPYNANGGKNYSGQNSGGLAEEKIRDEMVDLSIHKIQKQK